jgi:hypothetical protein
MKIRQVCGDAPNPNNDRRFTTFGPDFRATAADLAGKLALADRTTVLLIAELMEADKLITLMWRQMSGAQKALMIRDLEGLTPGEMRMTRVKERSTALSLADQYLAATGSPPIASTGAA